MGLLDWFKKQPKKDVIELKKDDKHQSVYATLNKLDGKGISHEEAQTIQAEIMELLRNKDSNSAINYACQLLTKGHYEACITAFKNIMDKEPSEKGTCENQIGAAYFFLGKYPEAVTHYLLSLNNGFDPEMLDYNVWEAAEAHHKATGDNCYAKTYLERFPTGEARDAAMKLL
jgi:tetratricopeptide (TPR) repeat protein